MYNVSEVAEPFCRAQVYQDYVVSTIENGINNWYKKTYLYLYEPSTGNGTTKVSASLYNTPFSCSLNWYVEPKQM